MHIIPRIVATGAGSSLKTSATPQDIEALARAAVGAVRKPSAEPEPAVRVVHPVLLRALTAAGIDRCDGPGDTLTQRQMDAVMAGRSISERISLRQLAGRAGILPGG